MKAKRPSSLLAGLLAALLLASALASCTPPDVPDGSDSTSGSESAIQTESKEESTSVLGSETESSEESASETETETERPLDTSALSLPTVEDLFPAYKEFETVSAFSSDPSQTEIKVEGENYDSINMPINNITHSDYSGGKTLRVHCGASSLKNGWEGTYTVSYKFTVSEAGSYEFQAVTHQLGMSYTSDYTITLDGKQTIDAANVGKIIKNIPATVDGRVDNGLIKLYSFGNLELSAGEHTLTFTVDTADAQASQSRIILFIDYFTFEKSVNVKEGMDITYAVELTGEGSTVCKNAARVHVFDCRYPLSLQINKLFTEAGEASYSIKDYFGKTLYEGKLMGAANQIVSLSRGIKNHPTGYFTLTVGDDTLAYVVTPSFDSRTLEDSPFAMDFASTYLVSSNENAEAIAAAARLAGVTWVRERSTWSAYESTPGVYNFGSTDARYRILDEAGLKILAMMEAAPQWAVEDLNSEKRAGGYLENQLSTYKLTKAIAEHYKGVVDAWELSNEPDGGRSETAEQYAAWFKAAALGIHAGDPDAIISNAGFCQPDKQGDLQHSYVNLALANGIMNYSSIFNFHCHTPQQTSWHTPNYSIISHSLPTQMYSATSLYNVTSKPIWITESGMRLIGEAPTQAHILNQARYVVSSTAQSLGFGTEKHFWFVLSPYLEGGGDFGTFSKDLQPYASLAAEAVMTDVLGEAKYVGEIPGIKNYSYARGILFNTGSRIAAVLWTFDPNLKYTYTFDATLPVIVTDLMGNKTLVEPKDGKISVEYSGDPVYITFSTPPTEYYAQKNENAEIAPLTFTAEDKIIMTPQFEGYDINNADTKKYGHLLFDGMEIKIRIGNYNEFNVSGSVSVKIPGYEVTGTDKTVTVKPFTEEFITLTLKKTEDVAINDFVVFEGSFGEYKVSAVAQVRSSDEDLKQELVFSGIKDGRVYDTAHLDNFAVRTKNLEGKAFVYLNNEPYENFKQTDDSIKINLSDLAPGKYIMTVAILSEGGDYFFDSVTIRYDGEEAIFNLKP